MKWLFVVIMAIWVGFGLGMVYYGNTHHGKINWCGWVFFLMVPFLPIIAHWCGL